MELLVRSGRDVVHTSMMMIPQAWEKYPDVDPAVKAFYEYHQCVLEPWDGPAALAFTDGVLAGAAVDRNGLRPCRYKVRRDGLVVAGSEVGLVDLDPREVVECGKVGPGEVLVVDTARRSDPQPRREAASRHAGVPTPAGSRATWRRWCPTQPALPPRPGRGPAPDSTRVRLRIRGSASRARAHGRHRRGPGVEHGRRYAHPAARGLGAEPSTPISGNASRR